MVDGGAGGRAQRSWAIGADDAKREAEQSPEVARAAVKWERGIGCFIKVRLINEKQKAESRKLKVGTEVRGAGPVSVVRGPWSSGPWSVVRGPVVPWSPGPWSVVSGPWSLLLSSPSGGHSQPGAFAFPGRSFVQSFNYSEASR